MNASHSTSLYSHKTPVLIFGAGLAMSLAKKGGLSNVREFYKSSPWDKLQEALRLEPTAVVVLPRTSFDDTTKLRHAITEIVSKFPRCSILVLRAGGIEDQSMVKNDQKAGAKAVLWHHTEKLNEEVFRRMRAFVTTGILPDRTPAPEPVSTPLPEATQRVSSIEVQAAVVDVPRAAVPSSSSVIPIKRQVHVPLLKEIVGLAANGVFTSELAKPLIYKAFAEKSRHGLLMGTIMQLKACRFIRRVAPIDGRAAWQVEESFLANQGMDLKIEPLPIFVASPKPGAKWKKKVAAKKLTKKKPVIPTKAKPSPPKKAAPKQLVTARATRKREKRAVPQAPTCSSSDTLSASPVRKTASTEELLRQIIAQQAALLKQNQEVLSILRQVHGLAAGAMEAKIKELYPAILKLLELGQ